MSATPARDPTRSLTRALRTLALLSILSLPVAGCERGAAEAAVSETYRDAIAEAAPASTGAPVARRLWSWEDGNVDFGCGDVSPDGQLMTFMDWGTGELGVWDAETGDTRRLGDETSAAGSGSGNWAYCSVFSPDGRRVAFEYHRDRGVTDLRVVDVDGGGDPRVLLPTAEGETFVPTDWAAPGILGITEAGIGIADPDHGDVRVVLEDPIRRPGHPTFSPDAGAIAFERSGEISVMILGREEIHPTGVRAERILGWPKRGDGLYFIDPYSHIRVLSISDGRPVGEPRLVRRGDTFEGIGTSEDAVFTWTTLEIQRVHVAETDLDGRPLAPPNPIHPLAEGTSRMPAWSPDGRTLAYQGAYQGTRPSGFRLATPDGRRLRQIPAPGVLGLEWGSDGQTLWYQTRDRLFRYTLTSGESALVTRLEGGLQDGWSLDPVRSVVYERHGAASDDLGIWALDYASGTTRRVVDLPEEPPGAAATRVSASSDGRWLAYFSVTPSGSGHRLLVVPTEGGTPREVLRVSADRFLDVKPHWSPDGRRIVFQRKGGDPEDGMVSELVSVPREGGSSTVVAELTDGAHHLALNLGAGRMAYRGGAYRAELWKTEVGGGGRR